MERGPSQDPTAKGDIATVPVAVVTSRIEAELIVGMLRNNQLTAAVSAGYMQTRVEGSAFKISDPLRIPLSNSTGTLAGTASTISVRTSSVEGS